MPRPNKGADLLWSRTHKQFASYLARNVPSGQHAELKELLKHLQKAGYWNRGMTIALRKLLKKLEILGADEKAFSLG